MGTSTAPALTGKQREIQLRDDRFIDAAQEILLRDGYHGLTMAQVAAATGFSKGTVYNHFSCKEELVVALGSRLRGERLALMERAIAAPGRPRERMVAIGESAEYFARTNPSGVRVLNLIHAEAILEKVSDAQREALLDYDARALRHMVSIVEEAIDAGDLTLPARTTPHALTFALWSLVDGGAAAAVSGVPLAKVGIPDPYAAIGRGAHMLMDGAGWRPLSTDWDYSATSKRIKAAAFGGAEGARA